MPTPRNHAPLAEEGVVDGEEIRWELKEEEETTDAQLIEANQTSDSRDWEEEGTNSKSIKTVRQFTGMKKF